MAIKRKRAYRQKFQKKENDTKIATTDWAGLPTGLIDAISKRLPLVSVIYMGDVCKSWRYVLAEKLLPNQTRGLPWLMLCGQNDSEMRTCLSILENKVWKMEVPEAYGRYCWGSVQDWLIVVKECDDYFIEIFFLNPFSRTKILIPEARDLYCKMVLSTAPTEADCVIILLGDEGSQIACWTPEREKWYRQYLGSDFFSDAVFCNGCFYFVAHDYSIYIIDAKSIISTLKGEDAKTDYQKKKRGDYAIIDIKPQLHHHQVEMPERSSWTGVRRYLVESCGEVLLVLRLFGDVKGGFRETNTFKVFKLDVHQMIWIKMENLGDRVLFMGKSDSRSFSTKELGADKANRIYFLNDRASPQHNEWSQEWGRENSSQRECSFDELGIFSLDGKCFIPHSSNRGKAKSWPPIWITAPVWWYLRNNNPQIRRDTDGIVCY